MWRACSISGYTELRLGSAYVGGDRHEINGLVMPLFREDDRRITPAALMYEGQSDDDDSRIDQVIYRAPAHQIRDRLEMLGVTLAVASRAFDIAIEDRRRSRRALAAIIPPTADATVRREHDTSTVLDELTFDRWVEGLREVLPSGIKPTYPSNSELDGLSALARYMLGSGEDGWYGFPSYDCRYAIRVALEVLPDADMTYDLSPLLLRGDYEATNDLVADASYFMKGEFDATRRSIVLTEGSTDKWILERSLKLLYPHLAEYFTFMDFEGARVAGGAGSLAAMVKAFVGAGIVNRIIAIFDNDTAGASAIHSLRQIALPPNIKVLSYPDLVLASHYPTLGPSGSATVDVNGLAGSIELYLGSDALGGPADLRPVQWKGYDEALKRYQGEVIGKQEIIQRFARKLQRAEEDSEQLASSDWTGIRAILDHILFAFQAADAERLLDEERETAEEDQAVRER
jgi:hypothetical protein